MKEFIYNAFYFQNGKQRYKFIVLSHDFKKSLKILKELSEAVNRRRTENAAKEKKDKQWLRKNPTTHKTRD